MNGDPDRRDQLPRPGAQRHPDDQHRDLWSVYQRQRLHQRQRAIKFRCPLRCARRGLCGGSSRTPECPLLANKRSSSHVADTSAYPPGADIQICDVRLPIDFVCSTSRSRPFLMVFQTAAVDPKRTFARDKVHPCFNPGVMGASLLFYGQLPTISARVVRD